MFPEKGVDWWIIGVDVNQGIAKVLAVNHISREPQEVDVLEVIDRIRNQAEVFSSATWQGRGLPWEPGETIHPYGSKSISTNPDQELPNNLLSLPSVLEAWNKLNGEEMFKIAVPYFERRVLELAGIPNKKE